MIAKEIDINESDMIQISSAHIPDETELEDHLETNIAVNLLGIEN